MILKLIFDMFFLYFLCMVYKYLFIVILLIYLNRLFIDNYFVIKDIKRNNWLDFFLYLLGN